jgi:hypothetical protein
MEIEQKEKKHCVENRLKMIHFCCDKSAAAAIAFIPHTPHHKLF